MSANNILIWLCISCLYNLALARSLSVSFNISLSNDELQALEQQQSDDVDGMPSKSRNQQKLSQAMLRSCMRETEISMSQLKLFRLSLLSNYDENGKGDYNEDEVSVVDTAQFGDMDYAGNPQTPFLDLKRNEPLQCFVRCLYERLGLIKYDVILEDAFKAQVQEILQNEKPEIKECMDLESKNRCEAAYKLHLCFNHLKTLEAEQRIREVLERAGGTLDGIVHNSDDDNNDNVIVNGIKNSEENKVPHH